MFTASRVEGRGGGWGRGPYHSLFLSVILPLSVLSDLPWIPCHQPIYVPDIFFKLLLFYFACFLVTPRILFVVLFVCSFLLVVCLLFCVTSHLLLVW